MPDKRQQAVAAKKAAEEWTQRLNHVMEVVQAIYSLTAKIEYEGKHTDTKRGARALGAVTSLELAAERLLDYAALPAVDAIDAWGLARNRAAKPERGEK